MKYYNLPRYTPNVSIYTIHGSYGFDLDDLGQVFFLPSTCVTGQEVFSKELDAVYHDIAAQIEGGLVALPSDVNNQTWDLENWPYPLVICYIAMASWEMTHRNRWFTVLKNGDFPWLCNK